MKRPSTGALEQQLMAQRAQQLALGQQEQAAFNAQRKSSQDQAAATVAAEEAAYKAGVNKKIRKPVTLSTILTSPQGILGNPILSTSRLGG
jgi:phosphopantetheinyl transferase (holo-ACP synthase)